MRRSFFLMAFLTAILPMGCSSVESTHVKRNNDICGFETTRLHGIPITLEVPHHFQVEVIETYWESDSGNLLRDAVTKQPVTTRWVKLKVENTKEIFTVDFIKPGAGTLDSHVQIDAQKQYFTSIDNTIQDNTIEEITNSISAIAGSVNPLLKADATTPPVLPGTPHHKVLAATMVEIADPRALVKIHDFLCLHLNGCNNCATKAGATAPSVDAVSAPVFSGPTGMVLPNEPPTNSSRNPSGPNASRNGIPHAPWSPPGVSTQTSTQSAGVLQIPQTASPAAASEPGRPDPTTK